MALSTLWMGDYFMFFNFSLVHTINKSIYNLTLPIRRNQVMQDKYGLEFPWSPKTPLNILLGLLPRQGRLAVKQRLRNSQRQLKQRMSALLRGALQGLGVPAKLLDKHLPVRGEL